MRRQTVLLCRHSAISSHEFCADNRHHSRGCRRRFQFLDIPTRVGRPSPARRAWPPLSRAYRHHTATAHFVEAALATLRPEKMAPELVYFAVLISFRWFSPPLCRQYILPAGLMVGGSVQPWRLRFAYQREVIGWW